MFHSEFPHNRKSHTNLFPNTPQSLASSRVIDMMMAVNLNICHESALITFSNVPEL